MQTPNRINTDRHKHTDKQRANTYTRKTVKHTNAKHVRNITQPHKHVLMLKRQEGMRKTLGPAARRASRGPAASCGKGSPAPGSRVRCNPPVSRVVTGSGLVCHVALCQIPSSAFAGSFSLLLCQLAHPKKTCVLAGDSDSTQDIHRRQTSSSGNFALTLLSGLIQVQAAVAMTGFYLDVHGHGGRHHHAGNQPES